MIKTLLATLAVSLIATPATSAWINDNGVRIYDIDDVPPTHQPLFNSLAKSGVPVVDGFDWDQCEVNAESYTAGFYIPRFNVIVLCSNSPAPDLLSTLTHEAVHAVQDCRAGQDNSAMVHAATQYMIDGLPQSELDIITDYYPNEEHLDEVEARFLEPYPDHVATQLDTYCL